ncbi:MAG: hypothetical protein AAFP19_17195 [Bacteroidota bacterium]
MRKKIRVSIVLLLICLIGFLAIMFVNFALYFMSHLEAYIGYCSTAKLPFIRYIITGELIVAVMLTGLYAYSFYFSLGEAILKYTLVVFVANLFFMAAQVIQYPLLLKISSTWNSRVNDIMVLNHPLLYLTLCHSLLALLLIYKNRPAIANPSFTRYIYMAIGGLILAEFIARLSISYEHCYG